MTLFEIATLIVGILIIAGIFYFMWRQLSLPLPRCDHCGKPLGNQHVAALRTGYCSDDCAHEASMEWAREVITSNEENET